MRRLILSMNVTVNGLMAGPQGELDWHIPFWNDELSRAAVEQLANADTLLFGRLTYQCMAAFWGSHVSSLVAREDAGFADLMCRHQKVVFSRSLKQLSGWQNSRLAGRNVVKEIKSLKQAAGKDLLIYGSGKLAATLMKHNLIDEYRLWVYPVALRKGMPLFKGFSNNLHLQQLETRAYSNGVILMRYLNSPRLMLVG